MKKSISWIREQLKVDRKLIITYCVVYFIWGNLMNWFGAEVEIAEFTYWWQVITCYLLYMVPISLVLRSLPSHMQYAYGLIAMGLLEFSGYFLGTSYAFPNNILDQLIGIRKFTLGMALFFAFYFPLGNWGVQRIYRLVFK
ncbi:hypothetical protein [Eudoraea sp.]|uniref:hypothetical protein n=1 Tax=Eudoraea sp. TaxID=1979955 RepID=UPI003C76FD04